MNTSNNTRERGKLKRWFKRIIIGLVVMAVLAGIVMALMPSPVAVDGYELVTRTMQVTVDETGKTRLDDTALVSTPLAGVMTEITLEPGDELHAGDVITSISSSPAPLLDSRTKSERKARVHTAYASYKQAQASKNRIRETLQYQESEVEKLRRLAEEQAIEQSRLERAEMELTSLREELSSAKYAARAAASEVKTARLAAGGRDKPVDADVGQGMPIQSPINGVVLEVFRDDAGVVQAGQLLVKIGDLKTLEVAVDVLTADAVRIHPGDSAILKRWGGEQPLQAHVKTIEPSGFEERSTLGVEEQRVRVILVIDSPHAEWEQLKDGFQVEVSIETWQGDDVLSVPVGAIFQSEGGWSVFRYEEGVARRTPVTIGHRNGFYAEINDGLQKGDIVILHPGDSVSDGTEVELSSEP